SAGASSTRAIVVVCSRGASQTVASGILSPRASTSEPDRSDSVDEFAQARSRRRRGRVEQEVCEPLGLVVLERDRSLDARVVPDAEADVAPLEVVVQVPGHAESPARLAAPGAGELDELEPLRRCAPRAVAKRVAHRTSASRAVVHRLAPASVNDDGLLP